MDLQENELVKATIDYLKVTFYFDGFIMSKLSELDKKLLALLNVEVESFEIVHRVRGYKFTYLYDENICIGVMPLNRNDEDVYIDHFCLELSATAYHQLEERGVDMLKLLEFCSLHPHKVNRIDIAVDDFGIMDVNLLKEKIRNDLYICDFRAKKKGGKRCDEHQESTYDDTMQDFEILNGYKPHLIDSRGGYSATWGSRTNGSTELQFYDKVAEKENHRLPVDLKTWLRFEMRFGRLGLRGDQVLIDTIKSIKEERFGIYAKSLLYGLIEFKEMTKGKKLEEFKKNRNINKCKIWRDYKKFLKEATKIKVPYLQSELEKSVERSVKWVKEDWSSTIVKLAMTGDYNLDKSGLVDYIKKKGISLNVIAQAKNYVLKTLNKKISDEDVINNLQIYLDSYFGDINNLDLHELYEKKIERNRKMINSTSFYLEVMGSEDE